MSFPGPGFAGMSSMGKTQPINTTPAQLQLTNTITITKVAPCPEGISIIPPTEQATSPSNIGWVAAGHALNLNSSLKYTIKNEQGVDIILVDEVSDSHMGDTSLILRIPEGSEVLRLTSPPEAQVISLLLPSGESLGEVVVQTKVKKDKKEKEDKHKDDKHKDDKQKDGKHKEDKHKDDKHKDDKHKDDKHKDDKHKDDKPKEDKHKKDKEEKKSTHDYEKLEKDKCKDSPKRRYVLKNPVGLEVMSVSLKSKPKAMRLEMKIKSLQRKGEICMVESVGGMGSFQIRFKSSSVTIPNEKLYATGAVIGIVELEQTQPLSFATGVSPVPVVGH